MSYALSVGDSDDPAEPPVLPTGMDWRLLDLNVLPPETVDLLFATPVAVTFERLTFNSGGQFVLRPDEVGMMRLLVLEAGRLESGFAAPSEIDAALTNSVRFIAPDADQLTSESFADDTVHVDPEQFGRAGDHAERHADACRWAH